MDKLLILQIFGQNWHPIAFNHRAVSVRVYLIIGDLLKYGQDVFSINSILVMYVTYLEILVILHIA